MSKTHIKNTQTETAKVEAVKIFVVGQYCGQKTPWKIIGVFDTEKAAIAAFFIITFQPTFSANKMCRFYQYTPLPIRYRTAYH